jgi:capsular exopolysaccharide synthesis family protein
MFIKNNHKSNGKYGEKSSSFSNFYQLFNRILFVNDGKIPKIITITSAFESEGKTTVAAYLSSTASLVSQDFYLLIDGDLRRPKLHREFSIENGKGFSDAIITHGEIADILHKTNYPNLHLITAGKTVANPMSLLSSDYLVFMMENISDHYRMIFIDGPPVTPVPDSLRLAQISDGVILVVRAGKTPREVVKRAVNLLRERKCNILGIVLNDVGEVLPYYYQNKYYRYSYN